MGFFQDLGHTVSNVAKSVEHVASKGIDTTGSLLKKATNKGGFLDQVFQTGKSLVQAPAQLLNKGLDTVSGLLQSPILLIGLGVVAVIVISRL